MDAVGAVPEHRNRPDAAGPAGVGEQGKSTIGVPQERRRSCRFHRHESGRRYRMTNSRRPPAAASAAERAKRERWDGTAGVKATKRGGRSGRKS